MPAMNEANQPAVHGNEEAYGSESMRLRPKIDRLIHQLNCPKELPYFSITFLFKTGEQYYLSNLYAWSVVYWTEGWYRADANHQFRVYNNHDFFIQRAMHYDFIQQLLIDRLESGYHLYKTFAMVRQGYDCDLLIETYHSVPVQRPEKLYYQVRQRFEQFLIHFLQAMKEDLMLALPNCQQLEIFQNEGYCRHVILRRKNIKYKLLSPREKECVAGIMGGLSVKKVAYQLKLSPGTVKSHMELVRCKLNCKNMAQVIAVIMKHGLLLF